MRDPFDNYVDKLAPNLSQRQRDVLRAKRRDAMVVMLVGFFVILLPVIVFGITNSLQPGAITIFVVFIVLVLLGAGIMLAGVNEMAKVGKFVRSAASAANPDMLTPSGELREDFHPSAPSPSSPPTPPRTQSPDQRPCPYCGTMNASDYSYCQKCAKPLPPPL